MKKRSAKFKKSRKKDEERIEYLEKNQIDHENALTELREKLDNLKAENEDIKKQVKHKLLSHNLYS